ncbi:unnamed protein product [Meganyctiphanes norvegica]|uniref:EF-hand domain-containing protein n=1 Tax=Meganyctiphanes norvegica TaxID=48144 RepID=A0AAV2S6J2_MEGNR
MAPKGSKSSSKKAKKSGSNVFDMFTQGQVAEFKDGFAIMDRDRDGVLGKDDLRGVYDEIGRMANEDQLGEMLSEAPGPINFTTFLQMFAAKQSGEVDGDDVVEKSFRAFEKESGTIDCENFRNMLMAFGDKFSTEEVDECFKAFEDFIDEDTGLMDANELLQLFVAGSSN